jgi:O-acetyl-ADP-ribose deacetylase (regulator of RNase III)
MIPISYLKGDATDPVGPGPKLIPHICNDIGVWGAGFVKALSDRWDGPEKQYRLWHQNRGIYPFRLGRIQIVDITPTVSVANMIAQHGVQRRAGSDEPPIRYDAVGICLGKVKTVAVEREATVHMPRIGCGLAGGQWTLIEPIIHQALSINDVPVYVYDLP